MNHGSRNNTRSGTWIRKLKKALHGCANALGISAKLGQFNQHRLPNLLLSIADGMVAVEGSAKDWPPGKIVLKSRTLIAEILKRSPSTGSDYFLHDEKAVESTQWRYLTGFWRSRSDVRNACLEARQETQLEAQKAQQTSGQNALVQSFAAVCSWSKESLLSVRQSNWCPTRFHGPQLDLCNQVITEGVPTVRSV